MNYNKKVELYLYEATTDEFGIETLTETKTDSFKAHVEFGKNIITKIPKSDGLADEAISDVIIKLNKRYNRQTLVNIKKNGYLIIDTQKYKINNFLISDIISLTLIYVQEINS